MVLGSVLDEAGGDAERTREPDYGGFESAVRRKHTARDPSTSRASPYGVIDGVAFFDDDVEMGPTAGEGIPPGN